MKIQTIDIMKGIGIILVVIGHTINKQNGEVIYTNGFLDTIYSFFMLMFFMMSGYLSYDKVGNWDWAKKHILKWVLPIIVFAVIYWVVAQVLPSKSDFYELYQVNIFNYLIGVLSTGFSGLVLWYLWALLFCYAIAWVLEQGRLKIRIPLILQMIILVLVINIVPFDYLGLIVVKWYSIFFMIGYVIHHYAFNGKWAYISLVGFPALAYFTNWMIGWQNVQYGYFGLARLLPAIFNQQGLLILIMFGMALLGTGFVYSIAKLVKWRLFIKVFSYLGNISIGIYLLHIIFVRLVPNYWLDVLLAIAISIILYEVLKRSSYINFLLFGGEIPVKLKKLGGWIYGKAQT